MTIINIYIPNPETPKYIKQLLTDMKGAMSNNMVRLVDFNTPLSAMGI